MTLGGHHHALVARTHGRRSLRPAPGRLVLEQRPASRARLSPDRSLLPPTLHGRRSWADGTPCALRLAEPPRAGG